MKDVLDYATPSRRGRPTTPWITRFCVFAIIAALIAVYDAGDARAHPVGSSPRTAIVLLVLSTVLLAVAVRRMARDVRARGLSPRFFIAALLVILTAPLIAFAVWDLGHVRWWLVD